MMRNSYDNFFEALGMRESSGNYAAIQAKYHYLGKYQMGEGALIDTGYYTDDGKKNNNKFLDQFWTGKDGVYSQKEFLKNHLAQENAVREYAYLHWVEIKNKNLDLYIGRIVHGHLLTISGILAGAHILGVGGLEAFIKHGVVREDGNQVRIVAYIDQFAGYKTPFQARKKLTGIKRNKHKVTISYQIDQVEWVSKEEAIQMVRSKALDGVIVANRKGTVFLRTRPDNLTDNNLVG